MICLSRIARPAMDAARRHHREHRSYIGVAADVSAPYPIARRCTSSPSNSYRCRAHAVAQFLRTAGDQVEHRLRIVRRARHHLQHVDRGGLLFDPLAEFAVALRPARLCVPAVRDMSRRCRWRSPPARRKFSAVRSGCRRSRLMGCRFRAMAPIGCAVAQQRHRNDGTAAQVSCTPARCLGRPPCPAQ